MYNQNIIFSFPAYLPVINWNSRQTTTLIETRLASQTHLGKDVPTPNNSDKCLESEAKDQIAPEIFLFTASTNKVFFLLSSGHSFPQMNPQSRKVKSDHKRSLLRSQLGEDKT